LPVENEASCTDVTAIKTKRALISCRASDIEPERIEWLWPGRIAAGKLTLIGGKPGLGKSQVSAYIAAVVSKGECWPCGEGRSPQGNVVFFSAEDGIADTIVPRLIGIGADRSRIEIVSGVSDTNARKTFDLKATSTSWRRR
jgi:putative DNA primase/helicase